MSEFDVEAVRALRGPNVWSQRPALEVRVRGAGAHALAEKIHSLQARCGCTACSMHVAPDSRAFAVEFEEEDLARACLDLALKSPGPEALAGLREFADEVRLGANTRALCNAARRRGIPVRRLGRGSLHLLGHGVKQRRLWGARSDKTSFIADSVSWEKPLAKVLLEAAGVPTPEGRVVNDAAGAVQAARELNAPVVVKPESANHGRAVFIGLTDATEIAAAFEAAKVEGDSENVVVERCIAGREHRVLVVGGRAVAAACGDPLFVEGDGLRSISQLLDAVNLDPRRGDDDDCPLAPVSFDAVTLATLTGQGFAPDSVPAAGTRVLIQRNGNLAVDVTDETHAANRDLCVLAAETIGLDIAGVDLVVEDISRPLREQGGAVLEVNAMPGLMTHLHPGSGEPRPVDDIIVASLFPEGSTGRIPIVCVNTSAEIARAIHDQLIEAGLSSGLACSGGIYVNGECVRPVDGASARAAASLLLHPRVEAAVLETPDESVAGEGLAFEQCSVVVMHDSGSAVHRVLRESVEQGGLILDPAGADLISAVVQAVRSRAAL